MPTLSVPEKRRKYKPSQKKLELLQQIAEPIHGSRPPLCLVVAARCFARASSDRSDILAQAEGFSHTLNLFRLPLEASTPTLEDPRITFKGLTRDMTINFSTAGANVEVANYSGRTDRVFDILNSLEDRRELAEAVVLSWEARFQRGAKKREAELRRQKRLRAKERRRQAEAAKSHPAVAPVASNEHELMEMHLSDINDNEDRQARPLTDHGLEGAFKDLDMHD